MMGQKTVEPELYINFSLDAARPPGHLVRQLASCVDFDFIRPLVQSGLETIVGAVQEPGFGPLVIFGLGGTTVELLSDHVSRLAPLTDLDAREMISGLHGSALLTGYRGSAALDVDALADILLRVSRLVEDLPELVELDCNPVIVLPKGARVVDSRLRLVADPVTPPEDTRPLR